MIRTASSLISSLVLILLILGLNTDRATADTEVQNIRKILALIKNYHRGYDYYRNNRFWNRNTQQPAEDPDHNTDNTIFYEHGYIHAQAKYSINFSDLHSIFVAQTLAMIYALKLKERYNAAKKNYVNPKADPLIRTYYFLANYGAGSESVAPAILEIMNMNYPESYKEFEEVFEVFGRFQKNIYNYILGRSSLHNERNLDFMKEATDEGRHTGLGIDGRTDLSKLYKIDIDSTARLLDISPKKLYVNYDDLKKENMFRSTAMNLLRDLLVKIAKTIDVETYVDVKKIINSYVHVQRDERTQKLIYKEFKYDEIKKLFPKTIPVQDPKEKKRGRGVSIFSR